MTEQGYSGAMGKKWLYIASCIFGWFSVMIRASESRISAYKIKKHLLAGRASYESRIKTIIARPAVAVNKKARV
jgi:hypothetical protein